MQQRDQLFRLVGLIYEAVEEANLWTQVLDRFSELVKGTKPVFSYFDPSSGVGGVSVSTDLDPSWNARYEAYYHKLNVHLQDIPIELKPGLVAHGRMLCTDEHVLKSEFYNDYLRPQKMFHMLGGVVAKESTLCSLITAYRPISAPAFTESDLILLSALIPHLERACRLHQKFYSLEASARALDELSTGIIATTSAGQICFLNRAAQMILAKTDGLALGNHGLVAIDRLQQQLLSKMLRSASEVANGRSFANPGMLNIQRPSGRRPYSIIVSPLKGTIFATARLRPTVLLFVTDPDREAGPPLPGVLRYFGLTRSEASVATIIMNGRDLNDACVELGILRSTARTHLRNVFRKLGVTKQGQMVAILLKLCGQMLPPENQKTPVLLSHPNG